MQIFERVQRVHKPISLEMSDEIEKKAKFNKFAELGN